MYALFYCHLPIYLLNLTSCCQTPTNQSIFKQYSIPRLQMRPLYLCGLSFMEIQTENHMAKLQPTAAPGCPMCITSRGRRSFCRARNWRKQRVFQRISREGVYGIRPGRWPYQGVWMILIFFCLAFWADNSNTHRDMTKFTVNNFVATFSYSRARY